MKNLISGFLITSCCLLGVSEARMGKLYDLGSSPFASGLAHKPGDLLTVIVNESASSSDSGTTALNKKDEMSWDLTKFFFPGFKPNEGFDDTIGDGTEPGMDLESEKKYSGSASQGSDHTFTTQLQVRIVEKVANNQFVIRGSRLVNLNGKEKRIYVSGVVRQADINANNSIPSHLIADAVVEIEGELVSKDLEPSYLSQVLSMFLF